MGGFTALHLAMQHPDRLLSAVAAGAGYGAQPERQDQFRRECEATAAAFELEGAAQVARRYAAGPPASSSRTRTRAPGPSSPPRSAGTPRPGPR
jgi:pimeloyl-ACP methyl ester carboxylesterase